MEIERTKVAHLEAERKLENLTAANDRLQRDRAGLTVERDARQLHKMSRWPGHLTASSSTAGEAASPGAAASAERTPSSSKQNGTLRIIGAHRIP